MKITRWGGAVVFGAALALALTGPAAAQQTETFTADGPISLAASSPSHVNAGEHVTVGALDLGPGEWTITASVRLFVADPDPAANDGRGSWKNSQGCGIHASGEQVGGAGGSSGIWEAVDGGKHVVLDRYLVPPDWDDRPIVVTVDDGATTTVELVCFIDQSHSGATAEDRASFEATDMALTAVRAPEPDPSPTTEPTKPATEPPAGGQAGGDGDGDGGQLPVTGDPVALMGAGAGVLLLVGAGLYLLVRRRRVTFTA